jgi:hypothetical protein
MCRGIGKATGAGGSPPPAGVAPEAAEAPTLASAQLPSHGGKSPSCLTRSQFASLYTLKRKDAPDSLPFHSSVSVPS